MLVIMKDAKCKAHSVDYLVKVLHLILSFLRKQESMFLKLYLDSRFHGNDNIHMNDRGE